MIISGHTRVAGVIGHPVAHSLSPKMHNAAFQATELDCIYVPFPVNPNFLGQALEGLFHAGVIGLNITVPFKLEVMEFLEGMSPEALQIGAVNLLTRGKDGWIGDNTDGTGFVQALRESNFEPAGKRVLLLGAGGAARAVAYALLNAGADELSIVNRTIERSEDLQLELSEEFEDASIDYVYWEQRSDTGLLDWADLIVNATTVGMSASSQRVPVVDLHQLSAEKKPMIADIVYTPLYTPLITDAKDMGLPYLTGEKMLLYQGVISWETWTGRPAPITAMVHALAQALST